MTNFRKKLREVFAKRYDSTDMFEAVDEIHDQELHHKTKEKDKRIKELKMD